MSLNNFGAGGSILTKLFQTTCCTPAPHLSNYPQRITTLARPATDRASDSTQSVDHCARYKLLYWLIDWSIDRFKAGVIMCVQFLEGPPPQKKMNGWAKKTSKFRRDFWQLLTLIANISGTDRHIEHLKKIDQPQPIPRWAKKIGELLSKNKKVLVPHIDQPKWTFLWRLHFGQ